MRFGKFILTVLIATGVSLFYVYQQTNIYSLAYAQNKKDQAYQDLLDKNNLLRYNLNVVTSLSFMDNKVLAAPEFEMPSEGRVVKMDSSKEKVVIAKNKLAEVFSIFGFKSQAEAKSVSR